MFKKFNGTITYPTKTVYAVGENLDLTGLEIEGKKYTDYDFKLKDFNITDEAGNTVSGDKFSTLPAGKYTVSHEGTIGRIGNLPGAGYYLVDVNFSYDVTIKEKEDYDRALYGDANCDGAIDMSDAVLIMQALANPNKYGVSGTDSKHITEKGLVNADVDASSKGLTSNDALRIQEFLLHKIGSLEPIIDG